MSNFAISLTWSKLDASVNTTDCSTWRGRAVGDRRRTNGVIFDIAFLELQADRTEQSRARERRIILTVTMANGLGRERERERESPPQTVSL